MDSRTIQPVIGTVTIDTMLNFNGDFDGNDDVTCKQEFKQRLQTGW